MHEGCEGRAVGRAAPALPSAADRGPPFPAPMRRDARGSWCHFATDRAGSRFATRWLGGPGEGACRSSSCWLPLTEAGTCILEKRCPFTSTGAGREPAAAALLLQQRRRRRRVAELDCDARRLHQKIAMLPARRFGAEKRVAALATSIEVSRSAAARSLELLFASREFCASHRAQCHNLAVAQRAAGVRPSLAAVGERDDAALLRRRGRRLAGPPKKRCGKPARGASHIDAVAAGGRGSGAHRRGSTHTSVSEAPFHEPDVSPASAEPAAGGHVAAEVINKHRVNRWAVGAEGRVVRRSTVCSAAGCSLDGARKTNQDSYMVSMPDASARRSSSASSTARRARPPGVAAVQGAVPRAARATAAAATSRRRSRRRTSSRTTCTVSIGARSRAPPPSPASSRSTTAAASSSIRRGPATRAVLTRRSRRHARGEGPSRTTRSPSAPTRRRAPAPAPAPPARPLLAGVPPTSPGADRAVGRRGQPVFDERGQPAGPCACGTSRRWRPASRCSIGDAVGAMVGVTAEPS